MTLLLEVKYHTSKKKFKKAVKEKEQNFKEKILQQISLMETNNPQKFWEMVNELRTIKQKFTVENIEPKTWHMWFKQLNTAKYDGGDQFEKKVDFFVKHLKTFQGKYPGESSRTASIFFGKEHLVLGDYVKIIFRNGESNKQATYSQ